MRIYAAFVYRLALVVLGLVVGAGVRPAFAQTDFSWTPSVCVQTPPSGNPLVDCPHVDDVRLTPASPLTPDTIAFVARIGNNSTFQRKDSLFVTWWLDGVLQETLRQTLVESVVDPVNHFYEPVYSFGMPGVVGHVTFEVKVIDLVFNAAGELRRVDTVTSTGQFNILPPAPGGFVASPLVGAIDLQWDAAPGALAYAIYRTTSPTAAEDLTDANILAEGLTGLAFTDADVSAGVPYFYRVVASGQGTRTDGTTLVIRGPLSEEATAMPDGLEPLPAPVLVEAVTFDGAVRIAWQPTDMATGYGVFRDDALLAETADTVFVDTEVVNGTLYSYRVSARAGDRESALSDSLQATPRAVPPVVSAVAFEPAEPAITDAVTVSAVVTDEDDNLLADSVQVVWWRNGVRQAPLPTSNGERFSGVIPAQAAGDSITFTLRAVDARGNAATGDTLGYRVATPPGGIALVARVDSLAPAVNLAWTDNGGAPFRVYRTDASRPDSLLTPADILQDELGTTTLRDEAVTRGEGYFYRVADRNGTFSNEVSATIPAIPDPPIGLVARAGDREVALSWLPAPGAESYILYRIGGASPDTLIVSVIVDTAYLDAAVGNDTTYTYWLEAANALGVSGRSVSVDATPRAVAPLIVDVTFSPEPPKFNETVEVVATIVDGDDNLDPASVMLLWRLAGGVADSLVVMRALTDSTFTGSIPPAAPGDTVRFAVAASDSLGNTVRSGDRLYRVLNLDDFRLSISPRSRQLNLSWEQPAGVFESFRILRADDPAAVEAGAWTILAEGYVDTSYVDAPLENGQTYFYRIAAERAGVEVGSSNIASKQPGIPVTPSFSPGVPNARSSILVSGTFNGEAEDLALIAKVELHWRLNDIVQEPLVMAPATASQLAVLGMGMGVQAADRSTYVATLPPQAELDVIAFFLTAADEGGEPLAESEERVFAVNARPIVRGDGFAPATVVLGEPALRIALHDIFLDLDGDPLTFVADSLDYRVAAVSIANDTLVVTQRIPGEARIVVEAADAFSGSAVDTLLVTVASIVAPLYVASTPAVATANQPYTIQATVVDEAGAPVDARFSIDAVELHYRRGGETAFRTAPMAATAEPTQFELELPAGEITERGVEYFVRAAGRTTRADFDAPVDFPTRSVRVRMEGLRSRAPLPGLSYRLVSFPLELDDTSPAGTLVDDFQAYDPRKWRFFEAVGSPNGDSTLTEFDAIEALVPGRGYWLITFAGASDFDMGAGLTQAIHEPFALPIPAGWSLIGNPFAFALPVGNLALASGRDIGDVRDYTRPVADSLRPFQGYAIYADQADVLLFEPAIDPAPRADAPAATASFALPADYALGPNFPNPFQEATSIPFDLPEAESVRLEVYNALGARVAVLLDGEERAAGRHLIQWDGWTRAGQPAASGLYVLRLSAGSFTETRTMVRVR